MKKNGTDKGRKNIFYEFFDSRVLFLKPQHRKHKTPKEYV